MYVCEVIRSNQRKLLLSIASRIICVPPAASGR
jgi:hypothetical protein